MNTGTLLASRNDVAVDGLRSTLVLYRNSANQFEWACTCLEAPEAGYREIATSEDASEFLMHPDTVLNAPGISAGAAFQADLGSVFTPVQLAQRWAVSVATVREMIGSGALIAFRVGPRLFRIRGEDVHGFEQRQAEAASYKPRVPHEVTEKAERKARRDITFSALRTGWGRNRAN